MERPENAGLAAEVFDQFCSAGTLKSILNHHRHLCDLLHIRPTHINQFYPKLKAKLRSWKAQALWNKFDKRASHKCYNRGKACTNLRVLVIGAGPCGLRTAIEAQLLGAKVVVVEKRDRITRNNVLHLWPFVIHDLKALGAKKFFGRFCAGAIDHISIRQLQCILLKVALILGVEIHEGVGFESLIPPPDDQSDERVGWRARTSPPDHPVSQYEFDALIGADGKRNTLDGFKRKEFRGKLAIAITANFINRHTEAEARVEEISGVAFIFNQKFFKELYASTGIDLENIVYYKDDTHYFVMTAKKHSLIDKGVIITDFSDTAKLLSPDNVDKTALMEYAREAADFSTGCRLPQLEFAVNHYGQPDVAMFDFTSMYAAENASRFLEKRGHRLMTALVGDSLLEPFWPTGSGCARGFLSSMDACWALRSWGLGAHPLEVMAERESIYRLLGQTTPENLHRDLQAYTLDPCTRYPNLNTRSVLPVQVKNLFDSDDPNEVEQFLKAPRNVATLNNEMPKKRKRRETVVGAETLLHWLQRQVVLVDDVTIENVTSSFKDGMALCAIISRYRPHLLDFASLDKQEVAKNNQLAFDILEKDLAIPPVMTGEEMAECDVPDKLAMLSYLSQVYEAFRGEIPHIKHPKMEETEEGKDEAVKAQLTRIRTLAQSGHLSPHHKLNLLGKLTNRDRPRRKRSHLNSGAPIQGSIEDRLKRLEDLADDNKKDFYSDKEFYKRDLLESDNLPRVSQYTERIKELERERRERARRREEIEKNRMDRYMRRKYLRHIANQQFYKSLSMLQSNARDDEDKQPIEDFSLFVYRMTAPDFKDRVKDLENKLLHPDRANRPSLDGKGGNGEDISGRVKDLEAKFRGTHTDKKPKDLLRAIGKIEKTDWNVKQIEQKIEENRMGRGTSRKSEKVPKWSKEQFEDKFSAVERKLRARSNRADDNKYSSIDTTMKNLEKKVKEGFSLEQGKVSAMAEHLAKIHRQPEPVVQPTGKQPPLIPSQGASELCHFCDKRVYLMERLSAEGKFFHRGCFRCQYCSTSLRLGNYAFDREGKFGYKFYCVQHFGLEGTPSSRRTRDGVKPKVTSVPKTPTQPMALPTEMVDLGSTPERVEFENLSCAEVEVEEDEFTDRNFGLSTTDVSDTSQGSDSSSDDSDGFAEAEDGGLDPEETLRLVKDWTRRYASSYSSSDESETEMEDEDDEDGDAKKKPAGSDSGSETESAVCSNQKTRQRRSYRQNLSEEGGKLRHYDLSSSKVVGSLEKLKLSENEVEILPVQKSKSVPSTSTVVGRDVKVAKSGDRANYSEKNPANKVATKNLPSGSKVCGNLRRISEKQKTAGKKQEIKHSRSGDSKESWKGKELPRSKSSSNALENAISGESDLKLPLPVAVASQVVQKTIFSVVQPLQTAVDFISKIAEKAVSSVTPSLQKADYSFVTPVHGPPLHKPSKFELDTFSSDLPEISSNEPDCSDNVERPPANTENDLLIEAKKPDIVASHVSSPGSPNFKSVDRIQDLRNRKFDGDSRLSGLLEKVNAIRADASSAIKQLEKEKPKIQEVLVDQFELKSPKMVNESAISRRKSSVERDQQSVRSVFESTSDEKTEKKRVDRLSDSVLSLISYETGRKALMDQAQPFSKYSFKTRSVSRIPDRPLIISTSGTENLALPLKSTKYIPYRLRKLSSVDPGNVDSDGTCAQNSPIVKSPRLADLEADSSTVERASKPVETSRGQLPPADMNLSSDELPDLLCDDITTPHADDSVDEFKTFRSDQHPLTQLESGFREKAAESDISVEIDEIFRRYSVSSVYGEPGGKPVSPIDSSRPKETSFKESNPNWPKFESKDKPSLQALKVNNLAESLSEMKRKREQFFSDSLPLSSPVEFKTSSEKTDTFKPLNKTPAVDSNKKTEDSVVSQSQSVGNVESVRKKSNFNPTQMNDQKAQIAASPKSAAGNESDVIQVCEKTDTIQGFPKSKIPVKAQPEISCVSTQRRSATVETASSSSGKSRTFVPISSNPISSSDISSKGCGSSPKTVDDHVPGHILDSSELVVVKIPKAAILRNVKDSGGANLNKSLNPTGDNGCRNSVSALNPVPSIQEPSTVFTDGIVGELESEVQKLRTSQNEGKSCVSKSEPEHVVSYQLDSNSSVVVKIPRNAIFRIDSLKNAEPAAPPLPVAPPKPQYSNTITSDAPKMSSMMPESSNEKQPATSSPAIVSSSESATSNAEANQLLAVAQNYSGKSLANSSQGSAVTYSLDSNSSVVVKIPKNAIFRRDSLASAVPSTTPDAPQKPQYSNTIAPHATMESMLHGSSNEKQPASSSPALVSTSEIASRNAEAKRSLAIAQNDHGKSLANSSQGSAVTYSLDSNSSVVVKIPKNAIFRRDSLASAVPSTTPDAPQKPQYSNTITTDAPKIASMLHGSLNEKQLVTSSPIVVSSSEIATRNAEAKQSLAVAQNERGKSVANSNQGSAVTYSLDSNSSVVVKIPKNAIIRRDSLTTDVATTSNVGRNLPSVSPVIGTENSKGHNSVVDSRGVQKAAVTGSNVEPLTGTEDRSKQPPQTFSVDSNASVIVKIPKEAIIRKDSVVNPFPSPQSELALGQAGPISSSADDDCRMIPNPEDPETNPDERATLGVVASSANIALPSISSAVKVSVQEENPYVTGSARPINHVTSRVCEIQSDDYSGDESSEEENSATEISTDSEFEHDGTTHTIPDIVISETVQVKRGHLEQPKQVQIVSRQLNGKYETTRNNDLKLELNRIEPKPAVNNILNNNRPKPLLNPNRGDYLLNRTQSTEGIASKISLELKKKYLLGPQGLSGNVKKSGSTSTLDTKFKSLIDQISEQQKLLHPAPVPSPTMQAFLQGTDKLKMSPIQLLDKKTLPTEGFKHVCALKEKDEVKEDKKDKEKEEEEVRPRSPVHETSIVVPDFPRTEQKELDSDSLSSDLSSSEEDEDEEGEDEEEEEEEREKIEEPQLQSPPKLEIHNSRGELMEDAPELDSLNMPDICQAENEKSPIDKLDLVPMEFKKGIAVPAQSAGSVVLTQVTNPAELYVKEDLRSATPDSSDSLKNDITVHTETEMSDWARDEDGVSEPLDDLEFIGQYGSRKTSGPRGVAKTAAPEDFDEYTHVCGKESTDPLNLDNLEFMDTGDESSEGSSTRNQLHLNRGYVQFVNNDEDLTPVAEIINPLKEELTDTTTTSEPTTVKDSPADGLQNLELELSSLPGKVPYGTVRDSIEVMKRNQKEALIEPKGNALNSPATTRKLEQLSQERAKQKDLIHEMVMNKLIAQGKSPSERTERKTKRLSRNFSPSNQNTPPAEPKVEESPKPSEEPPENNENRDTLNKLTPRHRSYTVGSGWGSEQHNRDSISLPDIHTACEFKTPLATPNLRSGLREQARAKFKMMSDEELGLSPEDRLKRYKLKIQKHLRGETPKSSRFGDRVDASKKSKEDRKKSIIQAVSDFFYKKSPSPPKTPSHSPTKNITINFPRKDKQSDAPPVPPPPQAYTPSHEDSLSEEETHSGDNTSLVKKQRVSQRIARQAQSKRLRMAQEVQRQLEELEIKQKELEAQGVAVEKALRGEDTGEGRNESELLAEWLRLTRERSEARSKEKMLVIRGQEIELEHRHARLQAQLSDIMSSSPDGRKSSEEVALEGRILREMLEIVERKNSLQAQLQAETQRFEEEDKDLEAQMLAKGLQLPQKSSA